MCSSDLEQQLSLARLYGMYIAAGRFRYSREYRCSSRPLMLTNPVAPFDLLPSVYVVLRTTQTRVANCILSLSTCYRHRRAGGIAGYDVVHRG